MKVYHKILPFLLLASFMWGLAGLSHEILLAHFYGGAEQQPHQGVGLIWLAYLLLAGVMAGLYPTWWPTRPWGQRGASLGFAVGLFWVLPHTWALAAAHGQPLFPVVGNALWHGVEQGMGGLAWAWFQARAGKRALAP